MNAISKIVNWLTSKKAIFIIVIVGFITYFNALLNGFVWDDFPQIINNQYIHSLEYVYKIFSGGTFSYGASAELSGSYYKPIMQTIFAIIYTIFGEKAFFFHLFQISIHIVNSILVYLLFKIFIRKNIALILSLIFLVHPINVEAVSYISALQDPLYFFFGMIAFFIAKCRPSIIKNISIIFIALLSVLSKETGFLFIPIVIFYKFIFKIGRVAHPILLSAILIGFYLFLRLIYAQVYLQKPELAPIGFLSLSDRLLNIPGIIFFYLKSLAFPKDFISVHFETYNLINFVGFYLPFIVDTIFLSTLIAIGVFLLRKHRREVAPFLFFFLWFILGISMHLQIFPLDMTVADRWFYFPMVGLLGMVGVFISTISIKNKLLAYSGFTSAILIIILLSSRSIIRNSDWKNSLTLFSHDIKISKDNFELEALLGYELVSADRHSEAKKYLEKSLKTYVQAPVLNNLGTVYFKEGDTSKALSYFYKSLALEEDEGIRQNIIYVLLDQKNHNQAKSFTEDSLKIFPQNPVLWAYLAIVNDKIGNTSEAEFAAQRCFVLSSNDGCNNYKQYK